VWVDRRSEEAGMIHGFKNSFQPILNVILAALDAPPIFMRTKALRALNQIVISDPDILSAVSGSRVSAPTAGALISPKLNVRQAIESHLLDSSPAVRDVAVELIGKSIVDSPEVAGCYYQKIADRIAVCFHWPPAFKAVSDRQLRTQDSWFGNG
jgi:cohesin loading factor subunit SCC2